MNSPKMGVGASLYFTAPLYLPEHGVASCCLTGYNLLHLTMTIIQVGPRLCREDHHASCPQHRKTEWRESYYSSLISVTATLTVKPLPRSNGVTTFCYASSESGVEGCTRIAINCLAEWQWQGGGDARPNAWVLPPYCAGSQDTQSSQTGQRWSSPNF